MRPGIFLDTGFNDGRFNMALDANFLFLVEERDLPPILRVYGWDPPAVSLGYFQNPKESIDLRRCHRFGVEVVKRPTGGRAILHLDDFTYSFIALEEDIGEAKGLIGAYLTISQALVEGLKVLGVEAKLERGKKEGVRSSKGRPCFASLSRYEIEVGGRKLVGSAQRRKGKVILQHGSIPLKKGGLSITDLLPSSPGNLRGTNLSDVLGREVEFDEVKEAIRKGFEITFERRFISYPWKELVSLLKPKAEVEAITLDYALNTEHFGFSKKFRNVGDCLKGVNPLQG
jgi:lipoate-protein ligase A